MDIPTSVNDVLKKANDGASAAMGEEISELLNSEWQILQTALSGEGIPPVVSISFSPNHDAFIAILEKYIKFEDSEEVMGALEHMNMVASIYNTVNSESGEEECAIDMDYYYGDEEFAPSLYAGRELAQGEKVKHFDHIPTTIDIIKMCVEFGTGTPLFDIDKSAPFYADVEQFLGGVDGQPEPESDCAEPMPPKIHGRAHVRGESAEPAEDDAEELPEGEDCWACTPKDRCPTCDGRENCAYPCYNPEGGDEPAKDPEDDEVPMEAGN